MRSDARFICDGEWDIATGPWHRCRNGVAWSEWEPCRDKAHDGYMTWEHRIGEPPSEWPKVFAVIGFVLLCGWIILGWLGF